MKSKVCVIGAGFSGLSSACHLAKAGFDVTVLEKNSTPGGRARKWEKDGYSFDMGPSWYWMPDVFEHFFGVFNKKPSDYYQLKRLDPSYTVKFGDEAIDIPARMDEFEALCEKIEPGSAESLRKFLAQAAYKYEVGINDLVYRPGRKITEFMDLRLLQGLLKMDVLTSMRKHVRKHFKSDKLRMLMEFPILFLGATPENTPALYSLMNYADIKLGTWYPEGGINKVIEGMASLATELGVTFQYDEEVSKFSIHNRNINQVVTNRNEYDFDVVVASADYHHIDQHILDQEYRNYSSSYWDSRVMAPSSLLYYLGVDIQLPSLHHHTLFFDEDFDHHAEEIYTNPQWPSAPLLYCCNPSKSDVTVAPAGRENLFALIPVAPDLQDTEAVKEKYLDLTIGKLEKFTGTSFRDKIEVQRSYAQSDFKSDYHSFKGNAYGLANTLLQTAILKPSLKNKKLKNLYFTGQLTVPGPGVPPSLISGEVVAKEIQKDFSSLLV